MLNNLSLQIDFTGSNWKEALGIAVITFSLLIILRIGLGIITQVIKKYFYKSFTFYIFKELGKIPWYTILFVSIYMFLLVLDAKIPKWLSQVSEGTLLLVTSFYFIIAVNSAIKKWSNHQSKSLLDQTRISAISYISIVARSSIWVLSVTIILQNIGIDVSTIITGIGLSGLAIAFALRSAIKDMIASVIILFERPVRIGDRISVGDKNGYVKKVGIKSTVLVDGDGREVILPNSFITEKSIKNYKGDETRDAKLLVEIFKKRKRKSPSPLFKSIVKEHFADNIFDDLKVILKEENEDSKIFLIDFQLKNNIEKDLVIEKFISMIASTLKQNSYNLKKIVLESLE